MTILILLDQRRPMHVDEIMLEQMKNIQLNATHLIKIYEFYEHFTVEFKLKTAQGDRNARLI